MQSIDVFFDQKAQAFSRGDITQACASLQLPTTVYFGDQVIFVKDEAKLVTLMTQYFDCLLAQGYTGTTQSILNRRDLSHGGLCVTVHWTHLCGARDPLREIDIRYYVKPDSGSWKIGLVEIDKRPDYVIKAALLAS